jgi:hypothetical protein
MAIATRLLCFQIKFTSILRNHRITSTTNTRSNHTTKAPVLVPPPPSWSVNDLRLTASTDDIISKEELATLARRCLIDVRLLSEERRDQLRKDVAGIMRCASVLLDAKMVDGEAANELSDVEVYDAPRGLTKMPLRRDMDKCKERRGEDWEQAGESSAVMQSDNVQAKLVEVGGKKFFSVVTKRE